jgi:uncharacterized tellurite resistance protein B-like protein
MDNKKLDNKELTGIAALLVHAAKIDDDYTNKEKKLISSFVGSFVKQEEIAERILKEAENLENNSNQLLNFTNIIKKKSLEMKSIVVKVLWKVIISNNINDEYESNLMRRICGLIYFPDKLSGEIKLEIIKRKNLT